MGLTCAAGATIDLLTQALCTAFELETPEDRNMFVSTVMVLKPLNVGAIHIPTRMSAHILRSNTGQSWLRRNLLQKKVKRIVHSKEEDAMANLTIH